MEWALYARWQGAGGQLQNESSRKLEIGQKEQANLCHILAFLYNQFSDCMAHIGLAGLERTDGKEIQNTHSDVKTLCIQNSKIFLLSSTPS